MNQIFNFCEQVWLVLCELAPWFLFGAFVAGLLHGFAPSGFVRKRFSGFTGVLWAVLFGIPLPLCSCAVIPTGIGLRRNGASEGASVGFLIATPQTGVDSVFVTAAFLGWTFAFYKLFVALILGVTAGWLIEWLGNRGHQTATKPADWETKSRETPDRETRDWETIKSEAVPQGAASCCQSKSIPKQTVSLQPLATSTTPLKTDASQTVVVRLGELRPASVDPNVGDRQPATCCSAEIKSLPSASEESCCSREKKSLPVLGSAASSISKPAKAASLNAWMGYLRSSLGSSLSIVRSIYVWVLLGVFISAALSAFLPADLITRFSGQSYGLQLLIALLIGIPLYVCATASVPIAAALVGQGLSIGAAAVLLIAGPATNVATIGAVRAQLSRLAFWTYLVTAIIGSVLFAVLFDLLFPQAIAISQVHQHQHNHWFNQICAGLLVLLFGYFAISKYLASGANIDTSPAGEKNSCCG